MSWDCTWRLPGKKLDSDKLGQAVGQVAANYAGVQTEIVSEAKDCTTCFFDVPHGSEGGQITVEISAYDLGKEWVLSLEADASDNGGYWDEACQLAEDLADAMGAEPLELD